MSSTIRLVEWKKKKKRLSYRVSALNTCTLTEIGNPMLKVVVYRRNNIDTPNRMQYAFMWEVRKKPFDMCDVRICVYLWSRVHRIPENLFLHATITYLHIFEYNFNFKRNCLSTCSDVHSIHFRFFCARVIGQTVANRLLWWQTHIYLHLVLVERKRCVTIANEWDGQTAWVTINVKCEIRFSGEFTR